MHFAFLPEVGRSPSTGWAIALARALGKITATFGEFANVPGFLLYFKPVICFFAYWSSVQSVVVTFSKVLGASQSLHIRTLSPLSFTFSGFTTTEVKDYQRTLRYRRGQSQATITENMSSKPYALLGISLYKELLRLRILGSAKATFSIRKFFQTRRTNQIAPIWRNFNTNCFHDDLHIIYVTYHMTWSRIGKSSRLSYEFLSLQHYFNQLC